MAQNIIVYMLITGLPDGSVAKKSACNARDAGSILGFGRSPGEGNGNSVQYFGLRNPMDRGDWRATVHGVTKELYMTLQLNNNIIYSNRI